jgi:outer membrane lipoprotein-sorting protein
MKALIFAGICIFGALWAVEVPVYGAEADTSLDVGTIIKKVDQLYRSRTSYAEMEMEIITPRWERTLAMKVWTEGMDKTFIRITAPKKEQGLSTLRLENEMWNYLPKTNKVMKIPPSMMMSSWMGSDFTNDDLVKEFSLFEDYSYEPATVPEPRDELYYINCLPREDLPVVWGNIVIACRRSDYLPVWAKYYDEKGELMRVWRYSNIQEFDGRRIPATMEIIPQHQKGHKTIMRYRSAEFNVPLDKDIFSLRNLRSGNMR